MDRKMRCRKDERIIIHFDYDCFYASVFEAENPALRSLPLAVQQKQIVVTCNYEARRRGLSKLQLITEAKKVCPEVIIVLGEDLTRFRNASKTLYAFLRDSIWSAKAERLGFDEVFLDCTDMIDYNVDLLNQHDLPNSFFCTNKGDPTVGFTYDASRVFGPVFPPDAVSIVESSSGDNTLQQRLILGSHLAQHLRHRLEEQVGYTATVGISTNKLLAKLVGNVNKPKNQTTLMPPYEPSPVDDGTPIRFLDDHDIGKVPGIGFKSSQKIRALVLGRLPSFSTDLVYGGTSESVSVKNVRKFPGMSSKMLEDTLTGPGAQKGIGGMIFDLIHGIDDTEVAKAKKVPSQISIEDSYTRLDTIEEVRKELLMLSQSLIKRMHLDLTEEDDFDYSHTEESLSPVTSPKRWLAHPRTLRLSTRPRPPLNPDGTRPRLFNRISRSCPMPNFVFSLLHPPEELAERLVNETLMTSFRKLHPERSGWNLSLVNIAATNMTETAADSKDSEGRDIGRMFRRQEDVLKDWKVMDDGVQEAPASELKVDPHSQQHMIKPVDQEGEWEEDENETEQLILCPLCQTNLPAFALDAHSRYHEAPD